MNHIDLFSGIGGFAYAAQQVWPDYRNLFFCDNNKFCQAVLRKNFGADSLIYGDIREVTVERIITDTAKQGQQKSEYGNNATDKTENQTGLDNRPERQNSIRVDLLTGGLPCQPFSVAGKRKGRDDDRHLWPEMFRIIKTFKPRWVIGENVRGLVNIENGMALQQVFLDLEGAGYAVQAFIIPACAVNAPHRRDRIWIVANCGDIDKHVSIQQRRQNKTENNNLDGKDPHATNAKGQRLEGGNTTGNGCPRRRNTEYTWDTPWLTIATLTCVRGIHDGLPARMDGLELSKSKHREERLKSLGNAIVPQVAIEIMRAIKEVA